MDTVAAHKLRHTLLKARVAQLEEAADLRPVQVWVRIPPRASDRAGPERHAGSLGGYTSGMAKVLFIPVSIVGGLIAGSISRKILDQIWGLFDEEEPPDSKHRDIDWGKLLIAAAIQGAIFRAMKEASDHYSRRAFYRTTGTWPGEKKPKPE